MRSGLCLLRPKLPAHTASDMLRCGKMTVLDSLCASGRTMGALLRRYLRRHQVGVQHGRQVQQRQDARLQRRQRRQMPDLRPGRREDRQRELLKGLQQPFGGRPLGGALRLSGVQAAQFLARPAIPNLDFAVPFSLTFTDSQQISERQCGCPQQRRGSHLTTLTYAQPLTRSIPVLLRPRRALAGCRR